MRKEDIKLKPDFMEFKKLFAEYDMVPVYMEVLADIETPVSVLARFAEDAEVFLLESVEREERFGRYSFIGINPRGVFTIEDGKPYYKETGESKRELRFVGTPLNALREFTQCKKVYSKEGFPPLFGGAIGFMGYECINCFEELPSPKTYSGTPEAAFFLTDEVIGFDNVKYTIKIFICLHKKQFDTPEQAYEYARDRIKSIRERLKKQPQYSDEEQIAEKSELESHLSKDKFCKMVQKAKSYIQNGEVIQIVLSQKFSAPIHVSALDLYRALRFINPSPYTFFLKMGNLVLTGSSPETMVKLENGNSSLRPIAGTRRRGMNLEEDRQLSNELLSDEKERAEHLMLVDLGRNDLGRTALPGSVQVKSYMNVEKYSHVMHLVSDVNAILAPQYDCFDLIRTTFPAGTVSGAPKIRAMELINELEEESRGIYAGAIGYISYTGNMDLAIGIRTVEMRKGQIHIQAGAGIVYDSIPEKEYQETLNKAMALFNALNLAQKHFII